MNLGQFTREAYGRDCVLTGFTTSRGTVTASSDWDSAAERKVVRPALADSYEDVLHRVRVPNFFLDFSRDRSARAALEAERLERAIGVIYRPETELGSHYFTARLPDQFDAVLHFDQTRAVEPLERSVEWEVGEVEETFPTGL